MKSVFIIIVDVVAAAVHFIAIYMIHFVVVTMIVISVFPNEEEWRLRQIDRSNEKIDR